MVANASLKGVNVWAVETMIDGDSEDEIPRLIGIERPGRLNSKSSLRIYQIDFILEGSKWAAPWSRVEVSDDNFKTSLGR